MGSLSSRQAKRRYCLDASYYQMVVQPFGDKDVLILEVELLRLSFSVQAVGLFEP